MFDLLIVIGFLVVLLLCSFRQPARCGRLLLVAAVIAVAFAASGMWGYLDALRAISGRGGPQFSQLIIGLHELVFDEQVRRAFLARALGSDGLLTFWCERPGTPLPSCASPAGVLLLLPMLLCAYAVITRNILFRAMLLSCLLLQLGVWFLMAKAAVGIALINQSVGLIASSSALTFLVLPYMIVFDRLQRRVDRRRGSMEGSIAVSPETAHDPVRGRLAGLALCALSVVPAGAAVWITYFYVMRDPNVSAPIVKAILHGDTKGDAETPIVRHLRQEIGLRRGSAFRGVAATYLGNDLAMEQPFGKAHRYGKIWNSELCFRWVTGNAHQNTGLWTFGIPTYDDYAHGITKPLMTFTSEVLTDRKTQFWVNMIRAYELVPDIMRMLGVRFVLSDAAIDMPGFTEVEHMEVTGEGTPIRPISPGQPVSLRARWSKPCRLVSGRRDCPQRQQSIGGCVAATSGIVAGAGFSLDGSAAPVDGFGRDAARPAVIRPQRIPISRRGGRLVAGAPAPAIFSLLVANGQGRSRRALAPGELPSDRPVVQGNGGCQIQVRFWPVAIAMPHRRCGGGAVRRAV